MTKRTDRPAVHGASRGARLPPQLDEADDQDVLSPDDWALERGRMERLTRDERQREPSGLFAPRVPLW